MAYDREPDLFIEGFGAPLHLDRQAEITWKRQEGRVCIYVHKQYCTSVTDRERICMPHVELLSMSLQLFYLPRELHPKADAASASSIIFDAVHRRQSISSESSSEFYPPGF